MVLLPADPNLWAAYLGAMDIMKLDFEESE